MSLRPADARAKAYLPWAILLTLLIVSELRDAFVLFSYPVAVGINGYFYVLQIEELAKSSHLFFPTHTSLPIYLLTALRYLTGNAVTAVKVFGLLLQAALCLGVFAFTRATLRNIWLGLFGAALVLIPESRLFFMTEYLNQLTALVLLVWACWATVFGVRTRRHIGFILGGCLLLLALFSHKSILIFAPAIAICAMLAHGLRRGDVWRLVSTVAIVILWQAPALISIQPVFRVPASLQNEVTFRPQLPLEKLVIPEQLLLALATVGILFFVVFKKRKNESERNFVYVVFCSIALWSLLITLNPFFNTRAMFSAVAGRSRLFSYLQVALLIPAVFAFWPSTKSSTRVYLGTVILPLIVLSALAPRPYGLRPEYLTRRIQLIDALKSHSGEIPPNTTIIAPHGDQFLVAATLGISSQQRLLDDRRDVTVYWLLNDVGDRVLQRNSTVLLKADTATVLVNDVVLKQRLSQISYPERFQLLSLNQHLAAAVNGVRSDE